MIAIYRDLCALFGPLLSIVILPLAVVLEWHHRFKHRSI